MKVKINTMSFPHPAFRWRMLLAISIAATVSLSSVGQKKGGGSSAASAAPASAPPASASGSSGPIEVEWLAYSALDKVLQKLADYSCGTDIGKAAAVKVVVLDPPALQALQAYDSFYAEAESINSAFVDMAPRSGAGAGIDTFADITGAVAAAAVATTTETSSSFTLQDPTPAIVLLSKLHKSTASGCKNAYYAGIYTVSEADKPDVAAQLYVAPAANAPEEEKAKGPTKQLSTKKLPSVPDELTGLAATRAQTLLTILGTIKSSSPLVCKAAASANSQDPCITAFNNVDASYNAFLQALSTPNGTTGQPVVSAATQGYKLRALFQNASKVPVLGIYLSVAASGGTQQVRKNLLTALFTGDWIRYSGGVSVNAVVFTVAGANSQIMLSDLVRFRTPLTKIKGPSDEKDLNKGDNLGDVFK